MSKRSVTLKAYCCKRCGLIFHTTKVLPDTEKCKNCGGTLVLVDKFKVKKRSSRSRGIRRKRGLLVEPERI